MDMDWYSCANTDGSCEGYVDVGSTPSSTAGDNVCNCGGPHDWKYEGAFDTDFNKYPKSGFYIQ